MHKRHHVFEALCVIDVWERLIRDWFVEKVAEGRPTLAWVEDQQLVSRHVLQQQQQQKQQKQQT
jgi:hypothetical protein